MNRRERIEVLLEYLIDVREGLPEKEKVRGDEMLALMCEAWNSEAYQELERLLPRMREELSRPYWHLAERYLRYGEVRVAFCQRCGVHHASQIGKIHRHGPGKSLTLQPKILRSIHRRVDPISVEKAIDWLEERYRGDAYLPKAVLMVESERRLRVA